MLPAVAELGETVDIAGAAEAALTVNVAGPLAPAAVLTVSDLGPVAALLAIASPIVTRVALLTVTLLTVTPLPLTVAEAGEVKFVPDAITCIVDPAVPPEGLRFVIAGAGARATVT